ncbi:MAG: hypothetical protein NXI00_02960 [Cytophagales bacterium]|nr:hypothetical protein [Cytophagales bacterium]
MGKLQLVVAITGHRDLLEKDKRQTKARVKCLYRRLRKESGSTIKLYSALAPGADLWVAECLEVTDQLVYVKIMPDEYHEKYTYGGYEKSLQPFHDLLKDRKNQSYNDITHSLIDKTLDYSKEHDRKLAYQKLGEYLVKNASILVALWDGVDGGGEGGTSDVVNLWKTGRGIAGNRIKLPKQPRKLYHLICPREKNLFPVKMYLP